MVFVAWVLALFVLWVVLSGKLTALFLSVGFIVAVVVALVTRPLLQLGGPSQEDSPRFAWELPWRRFLLYLPWLLYSIAQANLQVAYLVLHPRMPINPQMVRFRKPLPGPMAQLVLANSITLTPGTITVDVEGDEFLIHALSDVAACSVLPEIKESLTERVGKVFGAPPGGGPSSCEVPTEAGPEPSDTPHPDPRSRDGVEDKSNEETGDRP